MRRRMRYAITMPRVGTIEYVVMLASVGLHIITAFVGLRLEGFIGAGLSLLFPFAAQAYWIVDLWSRTAIFWNPFTIMCAAYVLLWVILIAKRWHIARRS